MQSRLGWPSLAPIKVQPASGIRTGETTAAKGGCYCHFQLHLIACWLGN
jgi:hypothetical protein